MEEELKELENQHEKLLEKFESLQLLVHNKNLELKKKDSEINDLMQELE